MFVVPTPIPMTTPVAAPTVALAVLLELHTTPRPTRMLLLASRVVAAPVVVPPIEIDAELNATEAVNEFETPSELSLLTDVLG